MISSPKYRVHRLRAGGLFKAYDVTRITNSGLVFGHYTDATGHDRGLAVWRVGGVNWPAAEQLIPVGGIKLQGVNDAGQFVGTLKESSAEPQAVFGALSPDQLPDAGAARKYQTLEDRVVCWPRGTFALGLNNRGDVIGCSIGKKQHVAGFAWSREFGLVDLESVPQAEGSSGKWGTGCTPISINNSGAVLGFLLDSNIALHWELSGNLVRTLKLDFAEITKITDAGHILWWTKLPGFVSSSRVLNDGVETVLPLPEAACDAEARDINNRGEIIGESRLPGGGTERLPCLWTMDGHAHDLNALIAERNVVLDRPRAINDSGWIASQGAYRGRYATPFLLEPTS